MGGRFCSIDRTLVKIRGVARIWQRERLFWKFDPILFDLQKKMVFAYIQTLFLAEITNSRVFSGQKHVISKK